MEVYKIGNAIVRVHGEVDREKIRAASERFMKQVLQARKKARKEVKAHVSNG